MILQSLYEYYQLLLDDPHSGVAQPGYSPAKVTFALTLTPTGEIQSLFDVRETELRGKNKKATPVPQIRMVPEQLKRSVNVASNFLCDNGGYFFGLATKGNPERAIKQFEAFRSLHEQLLTPLQLPEMQPFLRFLATWRPENTLQNSIIAQHLDDLNAGANIIIRQPDGESFLHDHPAVKKAWMRYKDEQATSSERGFCLVTGEEAPMAVLHPVIKGVVGAQSMGASIVSFNLPAFKSYGKEQGANAPVSESVAFGYTTALNYLLANDHHRIRLGDATVLFWATHNGGGEEESLFAALFDPSPSNEQQRDPETTSWVKSVLHAIAAQQPLPCALPANIHKDAHFHILGLSPNASRLSVRFWHSDCFGTILDNLLQHYKDMAVAKADWESEGLPAWMILRDLAANSEAKNIPPLLAGTIGRVILTGMPYPDSLFAQTISRIRADRNINYIRAAVMKAYLLRKYRSEMEGVLTVALNEENPSTGYRLGRLFALLERAQQEAITNINVKGTIVDRAVGTAATMPRRIFPTLLKLNTHHINKVRGINEGRGKWLAALTMKIIDGLSGAEGEGFPARLDLKAQGEFYLGYYHQKQNFFKGSGKQQGDVEIPDAEEKSLKEGKEDE